MYEIEKNVPMPLARTPRSEMSKTLNALMQGESFICPANTNNRRAASYATRMSKGAKVFSCRKMSDTTMRVWRVK